ncbi:hypothetical protein Q3V23_15330 [Streptomyces sp. VNUA116]|uniref:hypothetical protein n=1 Tax=Streptomyces sp. VNUA116 TaxID=3062449 RepID=UPI00267725C0|nr:hypothetical protein [Streptomyces sp. VNUA116]WKU45326.1 hypothetical protein Q3V23_15330 [Streptomyces sp. VNUA116]
MSWPQNPQQPHQPPQPPQPPQGGAPWGGPEATAVDQPAVAPPNGGTHHQPTVFAQPAVQPPAPAAPNAGAGNPHAGNPHAQATVFAQPAVQQPGPGGPAGVAPPPPPPGGWTAPAPAPAPAPVPPSGGGGGKNKTLLAVVGGVVALAVIGGGAFFLLKGGDDKKDDKQNVAAGGQAKPSGDPAQGQQGQQGQSQQPSGPDASAGAPAAPPAGWQTQTSKEHKLQYDVPGTGEKWKVFPQDTMLAYTDASGKPQISMRDTANFTEGGCASSANPNAVGEAGKGQLATVGTAGGDASLSIQENARNWAGNWGVFAYGGLGNKPKIEVSQAQPWKQNGIDGWTATAKVRVLNRPSPCVPPTAIVKSIVWKLPSGDFSSWIVYADQGVSGALPESRIDEIMKTVRPLKG